MNSASPSTPSTRDIIKARTEDIKRLMKALESWEKIIKSCGKIPEELLNLGKVLALTSSISSFLVQIHSIHLLTSSPVLTKPMNCRSPFKLLSADEIEDTFIFARKILLGMIGGFISPFLGPPLANTGYILAGWRLAMLLSQASSIEQQLADTLIHSEDLSPQEEAHIEQVRTATVELERAIKSAIRNAQLASNSFACLSSGARRAYGISEKEFREGLFRRKWLAPEQYCTSAFD